MKTSPVHQSIQQDNVTMVVQSKSASYTNKTVAEPKQSCADKWSKILSRVCAYCLIEVVLNILRLSFRLHTYINKPKLKTAFLLDLCKTCCSTSSVTNEFPCAKSRNWHCGAEQASASLVKNGYDPFPGNSK